MYFGVQKSFEKRVFYKVRHGTAPSEFKIYIFRGGGRVFCRFLHAGSHFLAPFQPLPLAALSFALMCNFGPFSRFRGSV